MDEGPVAATLVEYDRVNRTGLAVITLVIVVPLAAFATDGPWRALLICGAVVGGIGYAALGPSIRLDLRDGHLLRRFMTRRTDLDLVGVTEVDVLWIPYGPLQLVVRSPAGRVQLAVDEASSAFRRELGRQLRAAGRRDRCSGAASEHLYLTGS